VIELEPAALVGGRFERTVHPTVGRWQRRQQLSAPHLVIAGQCTSTAVPWQVPVTSNTS